MLARKFLCFIFFLAAGIIIAAKSDGPKLKREVHEKIIGLTPPDMVFIPGNNKMHSFWMGASEEPNINYVIYLDWIHHVFASEYPKVYEQALPHNQHPDITFNQNDPYLNAYITHPAFSYYPITGLTWLQIQNYLEWKTDRLNEYNLIHYGYFDPNDMIMGQDNFNTSAFLSGQFEGIVREGAYSDDSPERPFASKVENHYTRNGRGFILPAYRLPTEQEWEYASNKNFSLPFEAENKKPKEVSFPFGENYFPLVFAKFYRMNLPQNEHDDFSGYRTVDTDSLHLPNRLSSICDYNWDYYGVANMAGNVREWTANFYTSSYDSMGTDAWKTYMQNGFPIPGQEIYDADGFLLEKDSLGRMPFIIYGIDGSGEYDKLMRYKPKGGYRQRVVRGGTWQHPDAKYRAAMNENESSPEIGFRCAMTYTGIPVDDEVLRKLKPPKAETLRDSVSYLFYKK